MFNPILLPVLQSPIPSSVDSSTWQTSYHIWSVASSLVAFIRNVLLWCILILTGFIHVVCTTRFQIWLTFLSSPPPYIPSHDALIIFRCLYRQPTFRFSISFFTFSVSRYGLFSPGWSSLISCAPCLRCTRLLANSSKQLPPGYSHFQVTTTSNCLSQTGMLAQFSHQTSPSKQFCS